MLTIAGLWTSTTFVTILIAVAALDLRHILGLGTFISPVTFLVAVTAEELFGFRTVASRVSFLAAIETAPRTTAATTSLRAVSREMARCSELVRPCHPENP